MTCTIPVPPRSSRGSTTCAQRVDRPVRLVRWPVADGMELHAVEQRVVADRARVSGPAAQRLQVGLAGAAYVGRCDGGERQQLDGVDLDLCGADPVAAA